MAFFRRGDAVVDESLLRDLALPIVAEIAPAEVELYAVLASAYFKDPTRALAGGSSSGPLAFGLPELYVLVTPVMLAAMNESVQYVISQGLVHGWRVTNRALRRLFGRHRNEAEQTDVPAEELLVLTVEQWAEIRAIVARVAVRGGVPVEQADLIADAVVGRGYLGGREE